MTVLDAPSWRAKATRKMPPVRVTIAWVARPSLMTSFRPRRISSSVRLSFVSKTMVSRISCSCAHGALHLEGPAGAESAVPESRQPILHRAPFSESPLYKNKIILICLNGSGGRPGSYGRSPGMTAVVSEENLLLSSPKTTAP
ncbi:hypothetical protein DSECCO2_517930 [anaerobic digester metagenome]